MADKQILDLEQYQIQSYDQAAEVIRELWVMLVRMTKRMRVELDKIPARIGRKLTKVANNVADLLDGAFRIDSMEDYEQAAALYGQELAGALYQLQGQFAGLNSAMIMAAAPIVQVLLPAVQAVVEVLTQLANAVGYLLRSFLLGEAEAESFSSALTGVSAAGKSLSRSLAGFDQINRLGKKTTASGGIFSVDGVKPLTAQWKKLADNILELLQPLKQIDLSPAAVSLERLHTALQPLTRSLFAGLEWAWYNLFVPLTQWTVEELLPVFLETLTAALQALGRIIEELKPSFIWLWENCLQPLAKWAGDRIIAYLQGITAELSGVAGWIGENQGPVDQIIQSGKDFVAMLGQMILKTMGWAEMSKQASSAFGQLLWDLTTADSPLGAVSSVFGQVGGAIRGLADAFGLVDQASGDTWSSLKAIWEGAWSWLKENTTDPAYQGIKGMINSVIGLLNGLLAGVTTALNAMGRMLNEVDFDVPDWVPLIGGKNLSLGFDRLTAPQIPYLAQGAVLPANRPFMAVVGDQRHGTNVEAPLATIQEAVSIVMEDMIASNMAGHEATVAVLGDILQAILGIQIGDDVIGEAVGRYQRKMSVVYGGY